MKSFLFFLSLLYQLGSQIKNYLYQRKILNPHKAPLRVISVGNISFGGSEKTPLVMNLISFLTKKNMKTALISRGYKGKWEKSGGVLASTKKTTWNWENSGDEPFMIAQNIPKAGIFIGKDRLLSCQKASQMGFEVAVLDDAFQHRRIHRDLDIVLFDPSEKIPQREPSSSLKRAHILLLKKGAAIQKRKRIKESHPQKTIFEYSVQNQGFFRLGQKIKEPVEKFKEKKILAFCGIARPERFSSLLKKEDIKPLFFLKFPDHHSYPLSSIEKIEEKFKKLKAEAILTTEKDAIKVVHYSGFKKIPVYYLKIDLEVEQEFYRRILSFFSNKE